MKYWVEKEISPVEKMEFWKGSRIIKLEPNEIFVFGSNPQARHFAGAAKAALGFGAVPINLKQNKPGIARGLSPNNKTYALITKSLEAGYTEPETGITYHKEGFQSVSPEQIRHNVDELYETAKKPAYLHKRFLITYQYESWANGTPKKSLNGYTSQEMLEMFANNKEIPPNIIFHESYKPYLEKLYKNKQPDSELVVYEEGRSIDIKEGDIIFVVDKNERIPHGISKAISTKTVMELDIEHKYGIEHNMNGKNTYVLIMKALSAWTLEKEANVSLEQIEKSINELYVFAEKHPDKRFLIAHQHGNYPNRTSEKGLNKHLSEEIFQVFTRGKNIPTNIIFHESYKNKLEEAIKGQAIKNESKEASQDIMDSSQTRLPLDNTYPSKFIYKDIAFISNVQFIAYSKAKIFMDEQCANKILEINQYQIVESFLDGKLSKETIVNSKAMSEYWYDLMLKIIQLSNEIQNNTEINWEHKRHKVVIFGARLKFLQNPDLKRILMDENELEKIKNNYFDEFSITKPILQKLKKEFLIENKDKNKLKF